MIITPTFDESFDAYFGDNASDARVAWQAAAAIFTDFFSDDIHINITVKATPGTDDLGSSGAKWVKPIPYVDLFEIVSENATTQNDLIAISPGGSMTPPDPINQALNWLLTRAQAKALGVIPDDMDDDGTTTFYAGNVFTFSGPIGGGIDFVGVAAHEISEVMGRQGLHPVKSEQASLLDNFVYTDPKSKALAGPSGKSIYFSIDNGITQLNYFYDFGLDWVFNPGDLDAFDQFPDSANKLFVSAVDLEVMDVIGYASTPIGSVLEEAGHIKFLSEPGDPFNSEVTVQLTEDPFRTFGLKLAKDVPSHLKMYELLHSVFVSKVNQTVVLEYVKTTPFVGDIIGVSVRRLGNAQRG